MKYLIAVALAIILTSCAVDQIYETTATPAQTPTPAPVESTPAPVQQIQIIDGQVWVAIPVEGMPENK